MGKVTGGKIKNIAEIARFFKSSRAPSGTVILMAGPTGSGKTMAAEILAAETGRDIYRVDMAGVVSKYIGETEKNLDRVLETAAARDAVLLFGEADALFGKRTEIKDAHDRHTNIDTNYLLQRIENYSGLAILTTNNKKQLDPALLRRVRFVIEFPLSK